MKKLTVATIATFFAAMLSGAAHAETWKARLEVIVDKSPTSCLSNDVLRSNFVLETTDTAFSLTSSENDKFTVPISADGTVSHEFRLKLASSSNSTFALSGNVKMRDLRVYSKTRGCWYRLAVS